MDIAPDYAGLVFGLSNTVANMPGFLGKHLTICRNTFPLFETVSLHSPKPGPYVVDRFVTDYSQTSQWKVGGNQKLLSCPVLQAVFWVSCCVHLAGSLLYLVRGSASQQAWAAPRQQEEGGAAVQPAGVRQTKL